MKKHCKKELIVIIGLTALVFLVFFLPVKKQLKNSACFDNPLVSTHQEGVSLTTVGNGWLKQPSRFMTDAFSGDFVVFYNFISDVLLNICSKAFNCSPVHMQSVFYGPALAALLFLFCLLSIWAVTNNLFIACLSSFLVTFGGAFHLFLDTRIEALLHVPVHAVALATAQSLGWVMLVPCIALLHFALQKKSILYAIAHGVLFSIVLQTHILTWVNVAFIQLTYVLIFVFVALDKKKKYYYTASSFLIVIVWTIIGKLSVKINTPIVLGLYITCIITIFVFDKNKKLYFYIFIPACILLLPFMLRLVNEYIVAGKPLPEQATSGVVELSTLVLFYLPFLIAGLFGLSILLKNKQKIDHKIKAVLIFIASLLLPTVILGFNNIWGWNNHPYRFIINLLFGCAVFAAFGLWQLIVHKNKALKLSGLGLTLWLVYIGSFHVLWYMKGFGAGVHANRMYTHYTNLPKEDIDLLQVVKKETVAAERILNHTEFHYPQGVFNNALLFNYTEAKGWIPDFRYIIDQNRLLNRIALLYFLFPYYKDKTVASLGVPEVAIKPPPLCAHDFLRFNQVLHLYHIRHAVAYKSPLVKHQPVLKKYGWKVLFANKAGWIAKIPGISNKQVSIANLEQSPNKAKLQIYAEKHATYRLLLGGRNLQSAIKRIVLHKPVSAKDIYYYNSDWVSVELALSRGTHELVLTGDTMLDILVYVSLFTPEEWRK